MALLEESRLYIYNVMGMKAFKVAQWDVWYPGKSGIHTTAPKSEPILLQNQQFCLCFVEKLSLNACLKTLEPHNSTVFPGKQLRICVNKKKKLFANFNGLKDALGKSPTNGTL